MTQHIAQEEELRFPKTIIEPIRHMIETKAVGITFDDVLEHINCSRYDYHNTSFTISAQQYLSLHRWLKERTHQRIRMQDWLAYYSATSAGLAGMAALSASTIREALLVPVHYMPLYVPAIKVELLESPFKTRLSLEMVADLKELNRFLIETVVGVFNIIANQVTQEKIPRTIHFKHACTQKNNQYSRLKEVEEQFGFNVVFESDFNGMEGDSNWLAMKTRSPNEVTYQIAIQSLEAEKATREAQTGFAGSVLTKLNQLAKMGRYPSLEEYASSINLTPRTFIRRLASEGTSFKELSNEVWFNLAKDLLINSRLSVKQIADKSGFKSANSFGRAFKSLSDLTPKEWKQKNALN